MLSIFVGPLAWNVGDGTAVAATTTETSLLTAQAATGKWQMQGNWLAAPGQALRLTAKGRLSTPAATQGNLTFKVKVGAVAVATSATFVSMLSLTNIPWQLIWDLQLRSTGDGTAATFMHNGVLLSTLVSLTNLVNPIVASAPAVGTGFDASTTQTVDLTATWSNATAGNTIQLHQYLLESVV